MSSHTSNSHGRSRRAFMRHAVGTSLAVLPSAAFGAQINSPMMTPGASTAALSALRTADPRLHALTIDLLARAKYAAAAIASGQPASGNEFAQAFGAFLEARPARTKAAYRAASRALLAAPPARQEQEFGRYAKIPAAEFVKLDGAALKRRLSPAVASGSITLENFRAIEGVNLFPADGAPAVPDSKQSTANSHETDLAEGLKYKKLRCELYNIKCSSTTPQATMDNTGDHIAMGGIAIGATGHVRQIKMFHVDKVFHTAMANAPNGNLYHSVFYDGSETTYTPPRKFVAFDIDKANPFPHTYQTVMLMASLEDDGGFDEVIKKMWEAVRLYLAVEIGEAVTLAGTAVSATAVATAAEGVEAGLEALGAVTAAGIGTIFAVWLVAFIDFLVGACANPDIIIGSVRTWARLRDDTESYYKKKHFIDGTVDSAHYMSAGQYYVGYGYRVSKS